MMFTARVNKSDGWQFLVEVVQVVSHISLRHNEQP